MCGIFLISCQSSFINNCEEPFFGNLKSQKHKYFENHLFKKTSAHRFQNHICTNELEEFFSKNLFKGLGAFFTTAKQLIWASCLPTKK